MQAVFIFLLALVIALASGAAAWYHTRDLPPSHRQELKRARHQALWLEQRLDIARRERWDPKMIASLSEQLGSACQQLAHAELRAQQPAPVRVL